MSDVTATDQRCVIIGASHAGVTCAFALRQEGYQGTITLIDKDPHLPYHRPPLSKSFLTEDEGIEKYQLKFRESYEKEGIELRLGETVEGIDKEKCTISVESGESIAYDQLVLATGASALVPPISGIDESRRVFILRCASDVLEIKRQFLQSSNKRVIIIGGGFIGLEMAASFRKLGAEVMILEREDRLLSRVTSHMMSQYFYDLHTGNGVEVVLNSQVAQINDHHNSCEVTCGDQSTYYADQVIMGTGISVNLELATQAGLQAKIGIEVNEQCQTSDPHIWAVGDCTQHPNPHYQRQVRLESVQNATDQAKIAAASICGKDTAYNSIPWFWSDQYDVKLQMAGLSEGYDTAVSRTESDSAKRSVWYFRGDELLAVDAINNPKAYVLGIKFIKGRVKIDQTRLADPTVEIKEIAVAVEGV